MNTGPKPRRLIAGCLLMLVLTGACSAKQANLAGPEPDCRVAPPAEPVACTMEWDPVCGCDGRTYGNGCEARAAGVTRFDPGACDEDASRR